MKRLLLVTTSFPEAHVGDEAAGGFVYDFARALAAHARVAVVAPGRRGASVREGALEVHRFAVPRLPLSLLRAGNPAHWGAIATTLRRGARAVAAAAADAPPDHALGLWALPCGAWLHALQRRHGVPYALWALGSDVWTLGRIPLVRAALAAVLRGASHRFADGVRLAEDVTRICGRDCQFLASSRRLEVSAGAVPRAHLPVRLAFLGRWHPNKGIDLLLQALGRLDGETWSRIEAVRVNGGGPLEGTVREAVAGLAARGRPISVGGYLDPRGAAELLQWADYVVIPSRIESIPVIFSDAMQARCPVICSPVGDLPQLVARYGVGVVAQAASAPALAAAVGEAVRRPPAEHAGGLAAAAADFDVARNAARLAALLLGESAA